MNSFLSQFKWVLIGGGVLLLAGIIVFTVVLTKSSIGPVDLSDPNVTAADVAGPETGQDVKIGEGLQQVDSRSFSGKGKMSQSFRAGGGLTIVKLTHRGQRNFIVQLGQGQDQQLLINAVGQFAGSKALGLAIGEYTLEIEADGEWTAQIDQSVPSAAEPVPQSLSGEGQTATKYFALKEGDATFRLTHDGTGLFAPTLVRSDGTLITNLANEIGQFRGDKEVALSEGIYLVDVVTKGKWTIAVSQ
ncbi:MAG: hypothetical protein ACT4OM_00185 [Actinomycetota bacterium]